MLLYSLYSCIQVNNNKKNILTRFTFLYHFDQLKTLLRGTSFSYCKFLFVLKIVLSKKNYKGKYKFQNHIFPYTFI